MTTTRALRGVFMREALQEAQHAYEKGEVPVGAVLVQNNRVIARGHNLREECADPSAHAEILALREGGQLLGTWNLSGCTLYVTLEPCPMCAGAILQSRIDTVVFGAHDPKGGALRSLYALCEDPRLNHRCKVISGILREECAEMLTQFFASLRGE